MVKLLRPFAKMLAHGYRGACSNSSRISDVWRIPYLRVIEQVLSIVEIFSKLPSQLFLFGGIVCADHQPTYCEISRSPSQPSLRT